MTHSAPDDSGPDRGANGDSGTSSAADSAGTAARLARAEELVTDLQRDNSALRAELDVARADVEALQNALSDVTPLHRHVAGAVKGRLSSGDARVRHRLTPQAQVHPAEVQAEGTDTAQLLRAAREADVATARSYTDQTVSTKALTTYLRASRALWGWARRVLAAAKRRLR